jgi:hypothetical protein
VSRAPRRTDRPDDAPPPRAAYPLRLPHSLRRAVARLAAEEGTSVNQFLAMAAAEKVAALDAAEAFFAARRARAEPAALLQVLNRDGGAPPAHDDELPADLAARHGRDSPGDSR